MEFSYLKKGLQYFPVVDLKLKTKSSEIILKALVDSGATYSVFRADVAEYLGINIDRGRPIYLLPFLITFFEKGKKVIIEEVK